MTVIDEIAAERRRQVEVEGWTLAHDDSHANGEMAAAAACYANPSPHMEASLIKPLLPTDWPWSRGWWKPTTRRRDLVKAGALILAEIERLDRLPAPPVVKPGSEA